MLGSVKVMKGENASKWGRKSCGDLNSKAQKRD